MHRLGLFLFVLLLFPGALDAQACSFIREPQTEQQKFDASAAVIGVQVWNKQQERNENGLLFLTYEFKVLSSLKGDINDAWRAASGMDSCGFFANEGAVFLFYLNPEEVSKQRVSELTLYRRFESREALQAHLSENFIGLPER